MNRETENDFAELDPEIPERIPRLSLPEKNNPLPARPSAPKFKVEPITGEKATANTQAPFHWWAGLTIKCGFCTESFSLDADYPVIEITERSIPPRHFARFKCRACLQPLSQEKSELPSDSITANPPTLKHEVFKQRNFKKSRPEEPELYDLDEDIQNDHEDAEIDRLNVPERINIKTRTFEPNLEELLTHPKVEKPLAENLWGEDKPEIKKLPWKWLAFIGVLVVGAIFWSKYSHQAIEKIQNSETKNNQSIASTAAARDRVIDDFEATKAATMQMEQMVAAMRGYFSSTSIDEMSRYVRHPERIRPLMERYYKKYPIVANPMTKNFPDFEFIESEPGKNFWKGTCELSDLQKANVIVELPTTGEPKVDWETLVHHQPMNWDEYAKKRPIGEPMDFRVYIENGYQFSDEFEDKAEWLCYRLTVRDSETVLYGYVRVGSTAQKEFTEKIKINSSKPAAAILRLNIPVKMKAKQSVLIEKVVSKYWITIDPTTL
jgi:hypothetical protein